MSILLTGVGNTAGASLAAGVYYKDGVSDSPPTAGQGWIAGLPGASSGFSVTTLRVQASAARTAYSSDADYNGTISVDEGKYWDGAAWQDIAILNTPWPPHGSYSSDTSPQAFNSATPATIAIIRQLTCDSTSGGNLTVTAFTLT